MPEMRPDTREEQFDRFYPIAPTVLLTAWDWAKSFLPALHEIELPSSNRHVELAGLLRRQNCSSTPVVVAKHPERKARAPFVAELAAAWRACADNLS